MPRTKITHNLIAPDAIGTAEIVDHSIKRSDLDTDTPGEATITKLVAGQNVTLEQTGADAGTGVVTINVASASTTYIHNQLIPMSTWVVNHNLGKFPSVTVVDSANNVVIGDIAYNDMNTITLDFNGSAFSGKAYIN